MSEGRWCLYRQDGPVREVLLETPELEVIKEHHADLCRSGQVYDPGVLVYARWEDAVPAGGERWLINETRTLVEYPRRITVQLPEGRWGLVNFAYAMHPTDFWYDRSGLFTVEQQYFLQRVFTRRPVFLPAAFALLKSGIPKRSKVQRCIQEAERLGSLSLNLPPHHKTYTNKERTTHSLLCGVYLSSADFLVIDLARTWASQFTHFSTPAFYQDTPDNPKIDLRLLWQGVAYPFDPDQPGR